MQKKMQSTCSNMQYQICKKYAQYATWTYEIYMHKKCKYAKICKKKCMYAKKSCISMQTICTQNHMCTNMQFQNMHKDVFYVCMCVCVCVCVCVCAVYV